MMHPKATKHDLDRLEHQLRHALKPVEPRPEYRAYLHERLGRHHPAEEDKPLHPFDDQSLPTAGWVIAILGIVGGVIAALVAARLILRLTESRRAGA